MPNLPLISIIVPTYNRANLIGETLDSILAQTYTNWECIVVDDCSTDNTAEVMSKYCSKDSRFQYHHRPKDRLPGGNAARNYGFEISKGEYINWFDSDDILKNNHLYEHVSCHLNKNTDAVISNAQVFEDIPENILRFWAKISPQKDVILEMIALKIMWQTGAVSWKRSALKDTLFEEDLFSSQEWTFHLKQLINKKTYSINKITTVLIRSHEHRIGKIKSVKKIISTFLSRYKIFKLLSVDNNLNKQKELLLLNVMYMALYDAISIKSYALIKYIYKVLIKEFFKLQYKFSLIKVLFFSAPLYFITGKGYQFFKIK
ncbi:glycosyltransferase family 2 protein [Formosa sp. L2A11]|uniref:glycosyltransferase family 2 protein n=1 Tax=Formosa sp. L2A11 TaxID=2686363 RepID=UPI00131ABB79|nr:glycosyltransferase family 2 protein [Formosa sp. L2A11]